MRLVVVLLLSLFGLSSLAKENYSSLLTVPNQCSLSGFLSFVPLLAPSKINKTPPSSAQIIQLKQHTTTIKGSNRLDVYALTCIGSGEYLVPFELNQTLKKPQLQFIQVRGSGGISMSISSYSNVVQNVELVFNFSDTNRMAVGICNVGSDGVPINEKITSIRSLNFAKNDSPKMVVMFNGIYKNQPSLSWWKEFTGGLEGKLANMLIKPVPVPQAGLDAVLAVGQTFLNSNIAFEGEKNEYSHIVYRDSHL